MSSLTSCMKKAGDAIRAEDKAAVFAKSQKYRANGMTANNAAKKAIAEQLDAVRALIKAEQEIAAPTGADAIRMGLSEFNDQAKTLYSMPGGSWVLLDERNADNDKPQFTVAFSLGGGKWGTGENHNTIDAAYQSALTTWTNRGGKPQDFKQADKTAFVSGTQGPDLFAPKAENNATTAPDRPAIYKLANGVFARYQNGIWYRGEQTPQKALKTEMISSELKPKDRFDDQAWTFYAEFTLDKYGATKSLKQPVADKAKTDKEKAIQSSEQDQAPALVAPTRDEVVAKQEREEQAKKAEADKRRSDEEQARKEEDRKRIAQASQAAADTFVLGGNAMDNLTGQKDIFGAMEDASPVAAAKADNDKESGQGGMFARGAPDTERDLLIQHNLTAENLLFADRMGGLAVPSVAITKADAPMQNFGEITLLGDRNMADPKRGIKAYGADIYSPRYPEVSYELEQPALKKLNAALAPYRKEGEREIYGSDITRVDDLTSNKAFKAYADANGKTNWSEIKSSALEMLQNAGAKERLFQGFTNMGNRRYKPHTLENVIAILKKDLRGGENFNYGAGSLRAKFTPQFRSIEAIKKAKSTLVSKEQFEAVKEEVNNELFTIAETLDKRVETVISVFEDAPRMGLKRAAAQYDIELSDEMANQMAQFLTRLRNMPTEYFEGKLLRSVGIGEFKAAIVPEGTKAPAVDLLKREGLRVYTYAKNDAADRARVIKQAAQETENAMFARDRLAEASTPPANRLQMPVSDVQKAIDEMAAKWTNGLKTVVVNMPSDLPRPAPSDARGLLYGDTAYIVASNHTNRAGVQRTLAHEAIGHYGLWKMLGPDGTRKFQKNLQLALKSGNKPLNELSQKVRKLYVDKNGKFNLSPEDEANEIAAFAVEAALDADGNFKPGFRFMKEVYAKIAQFLRDLGINIQFTNSELQGMLVAATRGMEAGKRLDGGGQVVVAAARNAGVDAMASESDSIYARGKFKGWPKSSNWTRQEYNDVVSLLPSAYRNDPHRREPLPANYRDSLPAGALQEIASYGSIFSLDDLGNIQVDGQTATKEDYANAKAMADKYGLGVFATNVKRAAMQQLHDDGFVGEMGMAMVLMRETGSSRAPMATPSENRYTKDAYSFGTMMAYKPRGFSPPTMFARGADDAMANQSGIPAGDGATDADKYQMAGPIVDGREVRKDVPNMSSIASSLDDYTVLKGVREVPMSDFALTGKSYSVSETKRIENLAEQIKESGEINPLIVVIDKDGPYILEGAHRGEALFKLGAKSFPAVVVLDNESLNEPTAPDNGGAFARGGNLFAPTVWNTPDSTRTDKIIYELQDGRIDLKRVQQAIEKSGQKIEEKWDARLAETLYPGRVAHRSKQFLKAEVQPLLKALATYQVPMNELADYLHARGAQERNAQVAKVNGMPDGGAGKNTKGVLMTNQAAKDYLAAVTPARKRVLDVLAKKVDAITAGTRDLLVTEGLEKQSTIDAWTATYKNYVPMFRDEAESGTPHPQGSGFSVKGSASKRVTGSTKEVTNILAHVLMQREAAITRAEKNHVALSLYGMALSHPNPQFWTTIRPNMTAAKIGTELQSMGVDPATAIVGMERTPTITTIDADTGKKVDRLNPMYKSLPGAMPLRINGEDRVLMINVGNERGARMAENLKNLDGLTKLDLANTIVGKSTRWLASVWTQYNPVFGLVNLTRDTLGAAVNLGSTGLRGNALKVLVKTPLAIVGIARELASGNQTGKWQTLYRQFQEDGGQTGFKDNFRDAGDRAKAIEAELKALGRAKLDPRRGANMMLELLDGFNTTLENAVRLSAYSAALDKGMSRAESARLGRELTVDFNRKGRMGREAGPLYAFFNASVQGSARTIQTLAGPTGAKVIAGGLGLGVLQALMLAAAGYDDDELPEWVKTRALIIPMFDAEKSYVAIPYPLGLHVIPNTGRVMAELALNGGKDIGKRTVGAIGELAGAFNPLGGGNIFTADGALKTIAPTVVDPIIEMGFNKNFAGGTIEKQSYGGESDNRPGAARAKEGTLRSTTGQAYLGISKAINSLTGGTDYEAGKLSPTPERLRYIAQTVGGGLLREIENSINASTAEQYGKEVAPNKIPVLGRFYGEVDAEQNIQRRYYETANDLKKMEGSLKAMKKAGDFEAADAFKAENPELKLIRKYHRLQSSITKLNKEAVQVVNDPTEAAAIDQKRLELMGKLNDALKELEQETEKPNMGDKIKEATKGWRRE